MRKHMCNSSELAPHITHTKGDSPMWPLKLQHTFGINSLKNCCPNKGFNIRGSFGLSNRFIKMEGGSIQGMGKELKV